MHSTDLATRVTDLNSVFLAQPLGCTGPLGPTCSRDQTSGSDWHYGIMNRHHQLSLRKPDKLAHACVIMGNEMEVSLTLTAACGSYRHTQITDTNYGPS